MSLFIRTENDRILIVLYEVAIMLIKRSLGQLFRSGKSRWKRNIETPINEISQ